MLEGKTCSLRRAFTSYLHEQPFFASDPNAGRLIAHALLDYLFQGAGFNLLSCLGITQREEYWPLHPILNPQLWLSGEILPPVIQTKALFTLPLLCSGIYVVKHEFCIRQSMMTTKPVCVMLICQFFDNESGVMDTSAIPHTFQTYEIEMTHLKDFFRYLSSLMEQKEGTYLQPG